MNLSPCPKRKPRSEGGEYRPTVATQLTQADHARMMRRADARNMNRSQFVAAAVIALLDKLDMADKYPYSGCPSSAQKAERALRAVAEGVGHPAYVGANGDGEETKC